MNIGSWIIAAVILVLGLTLGVLDLGRPAFAPAKKTEASIVLSAHYTPESSNPSTGIAKYEPLDGCYLGAYIDLDPALPASFTDAHGTKRKRPKDFEDRVGHDHAMYFFYMGYGRPLPIDYLRYLAAQNKYVQVALEPNSGLNSVEDDEYLRQLADDLRTSGAKVFLRFASEMNGDWVGYHGDPAKYIEKWQLVTRVMRERAPNVAMVWCPYAMPMSNVMDYYPGDEYVDWVGVNLYNVTYFNQDPRSPARDVGPRELLRPMYDLFADRKPIMICEYATTHFSALENRSVPYFAANNIMELYQSLPREFPRVKAIYYFSSNNLALAHRRNNNYSLLEDGVVLDAYRKVTRDPYFLGSPQVRGGAFGEPVASPINETLLIQARTRISAWAQASQPIEVMRFSIDGVPTFTATNIRDWSFMLDPEKLAPGIRKIRAEAFNGQGELLAQHQISVEVKPLQLASAVSN